MTNMQKLYVENCNHETFVVANMCCNYVYAHGILEEKAGYDIVCYPETDTFDYENDRIEDVIAVLSNGEEIKSKLFFWHSAPYNDDERRYMRNHPIFNCHGLIIAENDAEAMKDAQRKYGERRSFI